ncbi:MAG: VTT domain-containing protein [Candidatus Paceibacterota bacterium]
MEIFSANLLNSLGGLVGDFPFFSSLLLAAFFVIRGEVATLVCVYLAYMGYLDWFEFISIGLISIILGDILLYEIGSYSKKTKVGSFFERKISSGKKIEKYLHNHTTKTIFLSKYALGMGTLIALISGWSNIDFKKFIKINSLSIILWMGIIVPLSWFFVQALGFFGAQDRLDTVGLILGSTIILFFVAEYFIQKQFEKESGVDI